MLRFAAAASVSLALAACANSPEEEEPVTAAEAAVTQSAVESTVLAFAPITSTDAATIAAQYQMQYGDALHGATNLDGSCATVETNNLTFVQVTFACTGIFATTGTLRLEITSPTTVRATADLMIRSTKIDGVATLTVPAMSSAPRTLEADLVIDGPNRELTSSADASWVVIGKCVTLNANGTTSVGTASRSWQIANKTVCHE
jgi:hypothetical protein